MVISLYECASSVFGFYASFILLECQSIYTCPLQIYIFVVLKTFHILHFYGHKNKRNLLKSCVGSITIFTPKEKGRKPNIEKLKKKKKTPPLEVSSFILDLMESIVSSLLSLMRTCEGMLNHFCYFCGFLLTNIHQQLEVVMGKEFEWPTF